MDKRKLKTCIERIKEIKILNKVGKKYYTKKLKKVKNKTELSEVIKQINSWIRRGNKFRRMK